MIFIMHKGGVMTLKHMNIFVRVYQNQSITKAAQELHMVQPAVSIAIKELEKYYGIQLFDRISRHIYPTEHGKRFYQYALHIVSLFDEMETQIKDWDNLGEFRVGSSITIGTSFLPLKIREFRKLYPSIKVSAHIKNSETIIQYILDNQLDIALVEGSISNPQIVQQPFLSDHLCLIAASDHPLSARQSVTTAELEPYDFLLREPGSAGRNMIAGIFAGHNLNIRLIWESASTQALVCGVKNGLGLSVLPYMLIRDELSKGTIRSITISDADLSREYYIIYHKNKYLSRSAKDFIRLCQNLSGE